MASGIWVFVARNRRRHFTLGCLSTCNNMNTVVTDFNKTPLLDTIRTPEDLRKLKAEQVQQVADELRQETIDAVSVTGGHFGAGLGVVD